MKVKIGEVVDKIVGNEDRLTTTLKYYIGGEHIDSNRIKVRKKGLLDSEKGRALGYQFHYPFEPGDVLFMTKNPYLKKCGQVDFRGICSIATFVMRSKDETVLLQDYLATITQTDEFWDYLEANKSGSVNYFITWKTLANYEFALPSIEKQRAISDIVIAAEELKARYEIKLAAIDGLIESQFIEMFGNYANNSMGWPIAAFKEFAKIDANMTNDYEKYADYPHIGIDSIEKETGELVGYRTVKEDNVISGKYLFTPEHIIYSKIRPNLNKVALPDFEGLCSADAYPILPNPENCNRIYLAVLLRSKFFLDYILGFSARSNMPKVNRKQISGFKAPLPPLDMQNTFAEFYKQSDKSKVKTKRSMQELDLMVRTILNENCC